MQRHGDDAITALKEEREGKGSKTEEKKEILNWSRLFLNCHLITTTGVFGEGSHTPSQSPAKMQKNHWLLDDMTYFLYAPPIQVITATLV